MDVDRVYNNNLCSYLGGELDTKEFGNQAARVAARVLKCSDSMSVSARQEP